MLLAEAGYADGFKLFACSTCRTLYMAGLKIIAKMWKDVGAEVIIKTVGHTTFRHIVFSRLARMVEIFSGVTTRR